MTVVMSISITKEQKRLLKEWGKEDERSASFLIRKMIEREAKRREAAKTKEVKNGA